ncbi:copper-binding protein [Phenylobacterium sp. 58.2.17]|uniref:copper-binding protein n=1 Tax=Phenylobacterium sp. 58.2.17 TaxID=2969306 RepID=UPI002264F665|nr:copper-binding protein [Phenylobacterium sp. 58.2.17]MCX7587787.1 copper-binding protein [Phenylobacterium sp. 58.2.17]
MKILLATAAVLAIGGPALAQQHDMGAMAGMDMKAPAGAQGAGVIKALDLKAGSVTLQHGPIAALKWPAMTMAFKADPSLLKTVKVGQKVTFTVKPGATPEVIAIAPAS